VNHVLGQLSGLFASHGAAVAPARALGSLSAAVQREANTLAYMDGFWLTVWFAIAALALVALIGRAPPGPFTPKSGPGLLRRLRQSVAR
jgi:DHA2 family multidrug resistance protein